MSRLNAYALAAWALAATMFAQPSLALTEARNLTLITGRGELLQFDLDVKQVATSEPKIADVIVVSPREVMINAKEPGKTTVVVWENGIPIQYNVDVITSEAMDFEAFKKAFAEQLPGAKIEVTGKGETIVLSGTAKDSAQIKEAGALAQTRAKTVVNLVTAPPAPDPRQVVLQVKFASIDRQALKQVGFNLFSNNSKLPGETTTEQFQSPRFSQIPSNGSGSSINFADLLNLYLYRPDLGIGATIKALEEQDVLQILAEPNLIAVDGKTASFLAGGSLPVPVLNSTSTGGSIAPVITVQWKPFGVQLDFTPTITPAGTISLKVTPEVSTLDYSNAITLQGFVIPAISTRRADTEVVLRDGESFAIAGLMDNRVNQTLDKVPGIGSIPIIGQLFRSRSVTKTNTELLVLITPHIVKPLSPEEKAKLPDFPVSFLPSNAEEKAKLLKKDGDKGTANDKGAAEFVGPRGEQEPK
jgi:pilus assembly protein CpaC